MRRSRSSVSHVCSIVLSWLPLLRMLRIVPIGGGGGVVVVHRLVVLLLLLLEKKGEEGSEVQVESAKKARRESKRPRKSFGLDAHHWLTIRSRSLPLRKRTSHLVHLLHASVWHVRRPRLILVMRVVSTRSSLTLTRMRLRRGSHRLELSSSSMRLLRSEVGRSVPLSVVVLRRRE